LLRFVTEAGGAVGRLVVVVCTLLRHASSLPLPGSEGNAPHRAPQFVKEGPGAGMVHLWDLMCSDARLLLKSESLLFGKRVFSCERHILRR
jgi:hypothetical protein